MSIPFWKIVVQLPVSFLVYNRLGAQLDDHGTAESLGDINGRECSDATGDGDAFMKFS
jgi:hypothetical protein